VTAAGMSKQRAGNRAPRRSSKSAFDRWRAFARQSLLAAARADFDHRRRIALMSDAKRPSASGSTSHTLRDSHCET
jgi:hypothetical protein